MNNKSRCRLCGRFFDCSQMSEEHYPAHSVGNDDIVAFDIVKLLDTMMDTKFRESIIQRMQSGEKFEEIVGNLFDNQFSKPLYPKGRTARSLCRECNTFLGKYDEAYLKFFNLDGEANALKGYQMKTKINAIKSIYGKFLSVPEAEQEDFDFISFLQDDNAVEYKGNWRLYFVRRDYSSDLMGFGDIGTGKLEFDEGVVYEFSDEKFIFDLMNFPKHACFPMTNIFDITRKDYSIIVGTGESGGYHAQILMTNLFKSGSIYFDK